MLWAQELLEEALSNPKRHNCTWHMVTASLITQRVLQRQPQAGHLIPLSGPPEGYDNTWGLLIFFSFPENPFPEGQYAALEKGSSQHLSAVSIIRLPDGP